MHVYSKELALRKQERVRERISPEVVFLREEIKHVSVQSWACT